MEHIDAARKDEDLLYELVEELSTSGEDKLNEKSLKSLKRICKKSDSNITLVYRIIISQIEKEHSEIRYSCFQIIDELFSRSHLFRQLLIEDLQFLMEFCLETNEERRLPPPQNTAKKLKSFALSRIDDWNEKFGKHYKKLELAYEYLKNVKKVDFAGMRSRTLLERNRQEELERKRREIEQRSLETVRKEMEEMYTEIESAVLQGNNCINLILPKPSDLYSTENNQEPDQDFLLDSVCQDNDSSQKSLENTTVDEEGVSNYHGMCGNKYTLTITLPIGKTTVNKTQDNADLLQSLQDIMNEVENQFLPLVNKWLNILTKCNHNSDKIRKCMELKNKLKDLVDKHKELEVITMDDGTKVDDFGISDSESDEEFLDVLEASVAADQGKLALKQEGQEFSTATQEMESPLASTSSGSESIRNEEKMKRLLEKAPVIPFDDDLRYWNSKKMHITPITKNDSLHKFWCNGEYNEEFIPEGLEESLRSRAFVFAGSFETVKWTCRAPMPNGKLCQRQDRIKCPFHGKIIPRNDVGEPTNPRDQAAEALRMQKRDIEEAKEVQKDVEMAIGKDLGIRKKLAKKAADCKRKLRYARLTDVKKANDTSRKRLEKKVLNAGALQKVDEATSALTRKRHLERFGSNFNYINEK